MTFTSSAFSRLTERSSRGFIANALSFPFRYYRGLAPGDPRRIPRTPNLAIYILFYQPRASAGANLRSSRGRVI
jgi:hypothetical protein